MVALGRRMSVSALNYLRCVGVPKGTRKTTAWSGRNFDFLLDAGAGVHGGSTYFGQALQPEVGTEIFRPYR